MRFARDKMALMTVLERWLPRLETLANKRGVAEEKILDEALEHMCSQSAVDYRLMIDRMIDEGEKSGSEMIDDLADWQADREERLRKRLNGTLL